ncbi:MAG: hypothetical protein PHI97_34955, partial [Desulfobulbus sp.]|nr:hypothetical protein [Desulfobulbus sp.]
MGKRNRIKTSYKICQGCRSGDVPTWLTKSHDLHYTCLIEFNFELGGNRWLSLINVSAPTKN